jgi:hypothetical protein
VDENAYEEPAGEQTYHDLFGLPPGQRVRISQEISLAFAGDYRFLHLPSNAVVWTGPLRNGTKALYQDGVHVATMHVAERLLKTRPSEASYSGHPQNFGTVEGWRLSDDAEIIAQVFQRAEGAAISSESWTGIPPDFSFTKTRTQLLVDEIDNAMNRLATVGASNADIEQAAAYLQSAKLLALAPDPPIDTI